MSSPSSCFRCSKLLALVSPSGLCPTCASSADTANPTLRSPPLPERDLPTAPARPAAPTGTAAPGHDTASAQTPAPGLPHAPAGYDLLERLGGGGMGDVYLAREHASERLVAMKFLRYPGSPDAVERFLVELRALARIDHKNVVRLYADDFLRSDPYFTMEYMPRGSLARCGPLPPAEAVAIARAVAGALSAAHAEQIIHRDLKPSNILLAADGTPKVADFGLAKRLDDDLSLTPASGALGTVQYMPPEQVTSRNGEIGPWSDVFGLGATLYHLLCGKPPFTGGTSQDIIMKVLAESPPRLRDVPAALEGIVFKCLEKDPKDRYQSMAELIADLDRFTAGDVKKITALPLTRWRRAKRWARRNRRGVAAALVVLIAVAGAAVLGAAFKPQPSDPAAEMRRHLAEGKPVELLGADGKPRWHQWLVGNADFDPEPPAGGGFSFATTGTAILLLLPELGIDRYHLSVELCQLKVAAGAGGGPAAQNDYAGVIFVHQKIDAGAGAKLSYAPAVCFSDRQASPTGPFRKPFMGYYELGFAEVPLSWGAPYKKQWAVGELDPAPGLPGPWRTIDIDVSPEAITVHLPGNARTYTRDQLQTHADDSAPDLRQLIQRPALPAPSGLDPRGAVGVVAHGSRVGVKRFVVTPILSP